MKTDPSMRDVPTSHDPTMASKPRLRQAVVIFAVLVIVGLGRAAIHTGHAAEYMHAIWVAQMSSARDVIGRHVLVDREGDIIITGSFNGAVQLGEIALTVGQYESPRFLAKYSAAGHALWATKTLGNSDNLAADSSGNILQSGLQFGLDTPYLSKFRPDGTLLWTRTDIERGFGIDDEDNLWLRLKSNGGSTRLVKLNPGGTELAATSIIHTGTHLTLLNMGFDQAGNCYSIFGFSGEVQIGGGFSLSSSASNLMIVKFSSGGTPLWVKHIKSNRHFSMNQLGKSALVDSQGSIYISGTFRSVADFDELLLVQEPVDDPNFGSAFVAKIRSDGLTEWAKAFSSQTGAQAIALDRHHNVFLYSRFKDLVTLDGHILQNTFSTSFVGKFDADGNLHGLKLVGNYSPLYAGALTTDADGNVIVVSNFRDTASFGSTVLQSAGRWDGFLAKFAWALPPRLEIMTSNDQMVLSWPASSEFGLESTTTLLPGQTWTAEPTAPLVIGNQKVVTFENGEPRRFFRLRAP
jgi:hypothetical protein